LIFIATILLLTTSHFQESGDGFYIISSPAKKTHCAKELRMITGKSKVCVANKPIIDIEAIDYVTDILYDPKSKVHYIDIGITHSGMQTLNKMVQSLPESKFAMVVQNNVICVFAGSQDYAINSIRIGEDAALQDLKLIHEALGKLKH